jgi:hypothetical protein
MFMMDNITGLKRVFLEQLLLETQGATWTHCYSCLPCPASYLLDYKHSHHALNP